MKEELFVIESHQHYLSSWFQVLLMLFKMKEFAAIVFLVFSSSVVNCAPNMILSETEKIYT